MHQKFSRVTLLTATALIASLSLTGCSKPKPAAVPPSGPPEVGIIVVKQEKVSLTTELSGRTVPQQIAEVRPQVSGIILKRLFTEGSDVKAGQILYQIDSSPFEAAFSSTKASQARVEASLVSLRLTEERYRDLVKAKVVSQQDYDTASAALRQAEAELAVAKSAVETARINLAYTGIKAPISGRIGRSSVTNGALVTANQATALATIQQLDPMYVDVTQSNAEMLRLKQNLARGVVKKSGSAPVKLLLEDGSSYPLSGTLKFSEVTVDQSTGSVTMRAVFPNPKQGLLPGMFVRATLVEAVDDTAILIPQRGVTRTPSGEALVMIVGAEEKVEPRTIKVVRTVGDSWLVSSGLKAGDRVILEGLQKARPGTPVKAVPFGSPPAAPPAGAAPVPAKK
ncbi:MAG TPA: efflux RND transporter periplasmic adaptor subunit [Desulfuromonadales bacterium]|nr:efflux RND transporter periplasmic adaptor subunit [Desulfuromonadales bacterium]